MRAGKRLNRLDRKYPLLRRETQLERQIYDGRETLSIVLDDVRVGDEIDYAFSISGSNPVFGDKFVALVALGNNVAPETVHEVRLLASPSREIHYAMVHGELQPEIHTVGGLREMVFRKDHIPRLDFEPGTPYSALIDRWLQFSEFADWAEVARWGASVETQPLSPTRQIFFGLLQRARWINLVVELGIRRMSMFFFGTPTRGPFLRDIRLTFIRLLP